MAVQLVLFTLLVPVVLTAEDLFFADGSDWQVVSTDHQFAEGMAWDAEGHFYFTDVPRKQLFKVEMTTGEKILLDDDTGRANGIAFGPDGRLYGCCSEAQAIYAWNPKTWEKTSVTTGTASNDITILDDGTIFYTDPRSQVIWRLEAGTFERTAAAKLSWRPNGIALSLDQKTLLVAEFNSDTIHGFPIDDKSKLTGASHPAYRLAVPSDGVGRLDGMMVLEDGRLLSGTALGTQIVPPLRASSSSSLQIIIPSPDGRPRCNYARISPNGEWLYTAYARDLLRRKLR